MPLSTERKTRPRKFTADERISELEDNTDRADAVNNRITRVEQDIDSIKDKVTITETNMITILERTGETKRALWGTNGNVGMVGRLARVEDIIADIKKLMWAVLMVVIGLAVGGVWEVLIHKP